MWFMSDAPPYVPRHLGLIFGTNQPVVQIGQNFQSGDKAVDTILVNTIGWKGEAKWEDYKLKTTEMVSGRDRWPSRSKHLLSWVKVNHSPLSMDTWICLTKSIQNSLTFKNPNQYGAQPVVFL